MISVAGILSSAGCRPGGCRTDDIEAALEAYVADKDARIGIAVVIDGKDTVSVNGDRYFPMLSVYKFPQALAVADYCMKIGLALTDSIDVASDELKSDTWSPMRDRYGVGDIRLPLSELLGYSLQSSDNNACDILFRLIGGPRVADSFMKECGYDYIEIVSTEDEMHQDTGMCYRNRATPLDMARLFDGFYRLGMCKTGPVSEAAGEMMMSCDTGRGRLQAPLVNTEARIGHKTGTGDRNADGRLIGVNDAGYIFLSDGRGYSIAVFVSDSAYGIPETERIIADVSEIVFMLLQR